MVFEESVVISGPFDEVLSRAKEALASEGFGTITEIDVQATLKEKIGRDMPCYVIVGACNPRLASRALDAEPQVGVLLPCNVVVRESDAGIVIEAMDPGILSTLSQSDELEPIADEARRLMGNALAQLASNI